MWLAARVGVGTLSALVGASVPKVCVFKILQHWVYPTGFCTNLATAGGIVISSLVLNFVSEVIPVASYYYSLTGVNLP